MRRYHIVMYMDVMHVDYMCVEVTTFSLKIDRVNTKVTAIQDSGSYQCKIDHDHLIQVCLSSPNCSESSVKILTQDWRIRFGGDHLQEMSLQAAQQLVLILSVCLLYSILYFFLCVLEKICIVCFYKKNTIKIIIQLEKKFSYIALCNVSELHKFLSY